MISLKKVYSILKPNFLKFINYSDIYYKDGTKATLSFHQNADYKQVISIQQIEFSHSWYVIKEPISRYYDKFFFKERYLIMRIFVRG